MARKTVDASKLPEIAKDIRSGARPHSDADIRALMEQRGVRTLEDAFRLGALNALGIAAIGTEASVSVRLDESGS